MTNGGLNNNLRFSFQIQIESVTVQLNPSSSTIPFSACSERYKPVSSWTIELMITFHNLNHVRFSTLLFGPDRSHLQHLMGDDHCHFVVGDHQRPEIGGARTDAAEDPLSISDSASKGAAGGSTIYGAKPYKVLIRNNLDTNIGCLAQFQVQKLLQNLNSMLRPYLP